MRLKGFLKELAIVATLVIVVRTFFFQAYNIPSGSMEPTLLVGDFILVNKLVYTLTEPKRGDIVVFKSPTNPKLDYIKRIIGMPGDHIYINGQHIFINGKRIETRSLRSEDYNGMTRIILQETLPDGFTYQSAYIQEASLIRPSFNATVPPGHYFVMGDNRDNSEDSRYWGFLPRENIVGKAFIVYFSGKTPPLRGGEESSLTILTGFKQLFSAFLSPRFNRIGKPI